MSEPLRSALGRADLEVVDVFAEAPLTGNPLAVVIVDDIPAAELRQALARELNLSETTFVSRRADAAGSYPVRIHTPSEELPFAGHPVLGTAWVVRERLLPERDGPVVLHPPIGPMPIDFEGSGGGAFVRLDAPAVTFTPAPACDELTAALAVPAEAVTGAFDPIRADIGPVFLLVPVADPDVLAAVRPAAGPLLALLERHRATGLLAVAAAGTDREVQWIARMFFDAGDLREDPATGSAAAAFGWVLQREGVRGRQRLDQGEQVRRPSRLYVDIGPDVVHVGGRVHPVYRGRFDL